MTERDKDYYKGQLIYENLDGSHDQKVSKVCDELNDLYPEMGGQYLIWWLQAERAGLFKEE